MLVNVGRTLAFAVVLLGSLSLAQPGRAQQEITLRFLNYKTGKPIKKISVEVIFWNGKDPHNMAYPQSKVSEIYVKTDKNGLIMIHVPQPIPEHIYMGSNDIGYGSLGWETAPWATPPWETPLSVAEVLKSGFVVPYGKGHSSLEFTANPGEITILSRKLPWWDRTSLPPLAYLLE